MAYCIQCGEEVGVEARSCPACGRPVGESSIGRARERQAAPAALKALGGLAALVVVLVGVAATVVMIRAKPKLDRAQLDRVQRLAGPSLVGLGAGGKTAGGVVLRAVGGALLVATDATVAPVGREIEVSKDGRKARGIMLVAGPGLAKRFGVVLVPEANELGAAEVKIAPMPKVDDLVAVLGADGRGQGSGHVLSFEDGPGAGTLVHDAPVVDPGLGYGLWSRDGALVALPAMDETAGAQVAVAAEALLERLAVREVPLVPGAPWTETAMPVEKGGTVAVALEGSTARLLEARLGERGEAVRGHEAFPGLSTLSLPVAAPAPLELAGSAPTGSPPARALVVVVAGI